MQQFDKHIELNKPLRGACAVNDWIRLFNTKQEEDLDMLKVKNRGMKEAIEIPENLSLRKTLRYLREERLKAIRDRKERMMMCEMRDEQKEKSKISSSFWKSWGPSPPTFVREL